MGEGGGEDGTENGCFPEWMCSFAGQMFVSFLTGADAMGT